MLSSVDANRKTPVSDDFPCCQAPAHRLPMAGKSEGHEKDNGGFFFLPLRAATSWPPGGQTLGPFGTLTDGVRGSAPSSNNRSVKVSERRLKRLQ